MDTIERAKRLTKTDLLALREALIKTVTDIIRERGRDGELPIFSERSSSKPGVTYGHHISVKTGGYCVRYCAQCLTTFTYHSGGTGVTIICEDEFGDTQELTLRNLDTDELASLCETLADYSDEEFASARYWWDRYTAEDEE